MIWTALILAGLGSLVVSSAAFVLPCHITVRSGSLKMASEATHPFCTLPGDPSLILTTNVDLGDKKLEIMKACSKAIAKNTGKPESYIAVSINDKADVIFGGTDEPAALGCLYSIGAISAESNGGVTKDVTDLIEPFGVAENRIYINFFDVPRANVGWSRRTFAG
mmetsp:Transcript_14087/g.32615  ORF Transcript_14087/g.32615 Transcript_14087/m.32615 type:complete len:165 (-) Transcript_14087:1339-1833(-)